MADQGRSASNLPTNKHNKSALKETLRRTNEEMRVLEVPNKVA